MDPVILFAEPDAIEAAVRDVLQKAGPRGHILNLGHGVVVGTLPSHQVVCVRRCQICSGCREKGFCLTTTQTVVQVHQRSQ